MSQEANDFFNKLFSVEGDISEGCNLGLLQLKQFLFELIHEIVVQLQRHAPLTISTVNLFEEV